MLSVETVSLFFMAAIALGIAVIFQSSTLAYKAWRPASLPLWPSNWPSPGLRLLTACFWYKISVMKYHWGFYFVLCLILPLGSFSQESEKASGPQVFFDAETRLYGFKDESGKVICAPKFMTATPFLANGVSLAQSDRRSHLLVNKEGKILLEFNDLMSRKTDVLVYHFGGKAGFYNFNNNEKLLGIEFEDVRYIGEGFYDVLIARGDPTQKTTDQHVVMDKEGTIISKFSLKSVGVFDGGMVQITDDKDQIGYIDGKGDVVGLLQKKLQVFSEGRQASSIIRSKKTIWGYVDKTGKFVIRPTYIVTSPFEDGMASISKASGKKIKFGLINVEGKTLMSAKYDAPGRYSNGLFLFTKSLKKGTEYTVVNPEGKYRRFSRHTLLEVLSPNLISSKKIGGNTALLQDIKGKTVIDDGDYIKFERHVDNFIIAHNAERRLALFDMLGQKMFDGFESISGFYGDLAIVNVGTHSNVNLGLVNKAGQVVLTPAYKEIIIDHPAFKLGSYDQDIYYRGLLAVKVDKKYGFINKEGKMIIPANLTNFFYHNNFIEAYEEKDYVYYDYDGNELFRGAPLKVKEVGKHSVITFRNAKNQTQQFVIDDKAKVLVAPLRADPRLLEKSLRGGKITEVITDVKFLRLLMQQPAIGLITDPKTRRVTGYTMENDVGTQELPEFIASIKVFMQGRAVYRTKDRKFGIISFEGKPVGQLMFDVEPGTFKGGHSILKTRVDKKIQHSVINLKGEIILEGLEQAPLVFDDFLVLRQRNSQGIFFPKTKKRLPNIYSRINVLESADKEKRFVELRSGQYSSLYNTDGNEILPPLYSNFKIYENVILAKRFGFMGMVNHKGEELLPFGFQKIELFDKGLWLATDMKELQLFSIQDGKVITKTKKFSSLVKRNVVTEFTDDENRYTLQKDGTLKAILKNKHSKLYRSRIIKKSSRHRGRVILDKEKYFIFIKEAKYNP
jgi:hypothetical protein